MLASTIPKTLKPVTRTALEYAKQQWPVFPLKPGSKFPATPTHTATNCDQTDPACIGGHAGWEQRATTNHVRITRAWEQHNYGIAIACGPANLLVVDLDTPKNGDQSGATSLCELERLHSETLPDTYTVVTPSGGYHLYYQQPNNVTLRNSAGKLGAGIDTRGHGGYVAAPPTQLANRQNPYQVLKNLPVQVLPQWFSNLLTSNSHEKRAEPLRKTTTAVPMRHPNARLQAYVETAIDGQLDKLANAPVGQRNAVLFATAVSLGQLVGAGVADENTIIERIRNAATVHVGTKNYTWGEIDRTITSGLRIGIAEPRNLPAHLQEKP